MFEKLTFSIVGEGHSRKVEGEIEMPETGCAVMVNVKGMENAHGNCLFALDVFQGQLRLFIWGKRDGEEYTHVIDLDEGKVVECHE